MLGLSGNRPVEPGDWVEFRFSDLKAIQVPRGWDKLFVTILRDGGSNTSNFHVGDLQVNFFRDGEPKESNFNVNDLQINPHATDVESRVFDSLSPQSSTSSSSNEKREPEKRQTSFSARGSQDSYELDSTDIFLSREDLSASTNGHTSRSNAHSNRNPANEELLVEAKMWERNARKLMLDLDKLRKEFSDDQTNLEMKLKKSQESNIELVSLLQDMESSWQEKMEENAELATQLQQLQHDSADLISELEALREKVPELERDCNELTDENLELLFKLKELHNNSSDKVHDVLAQKLESGRLELEHFKSLAEDLQDEVTRLRNGTGIQKVELKQELESMQRRSSAVEEECESLKRSNLALQATADKLVEECTSLQRSNGELGLLLNENCVKFEAKLAAILEENEKRGKLVAEEGLFTEIEAYLQEVESRLNRAENELNVIHKETDEIVDGLRAELCATKLEKEELQCELEDCKRSRVALESKLLEIESDRNGINRTNGQLQRKIQQLEKEKDEFVTKNRALDDEHKAVKAHGAAKINAKVSPAREDTKFFAKSETAKIPSCPRDGRRKPSLKNDPTLEPVRNRLKPCNIQHHKEGSNGSWVHDQHPQSVELDSFSKTQWLENELAKAVEANKIYKSQLLRLKSETRIPRYGGEVVTKERFERTKSALETELKDIRDRYSNMSLRYAEVEAQREELVMKLKAAKNDKRRFSFLAVQTALTSKKFGS